MGTLLIPDHPEERGGGGAHSWAVTTEAPVSAGHGAGAGGAFRWQGLEPTATHRGSSLGAETGFCSGTCALTGGCLHQGGDHPNRGASVGKGLRPAEPGRPHFLMASVAYLVPGLNQYDHAPRDQGWGGRGTGHGPCPGKGPGHHLPPFLVIVTMTAWYLGTAPPGASRPLQEGGG